MHTKSNYSKFNNYINQGQLRLRVYRHFYFSCQKLNRQTNRLHAIHNQLEILHRIFGNFRKSLTISKAQKKNRNFSTYTVVFLHTRIKCRCSCKIGVKKYCRHLILSHIISIVTRLCILRFHTQRIHRWTVYEIWIFANKPRRVACVRFRFFFLIHILQNATFCDLSARFSDGC